MVLLSRLMFVFSRFFLRDYVTNKKTGQQLNKLLSLSFYLNRGERMRAPNQQWSFCYGIPEMKLSIANGSIKAPKAEPIFTE